MQPETIDKLPGDYLAGFVEGEGCFALKYRLDRKIRNGKTREYFYWNAEFAIVLRSDDANLLHKIRDTLGCGSVTFVNGGKLARYSVQNPKLLREIFIPLFNKHPLRGKKASDFKLWSRGVELISGARLKNINVKKGVRGFISNHLEPDIEKELHKIRNQMLEYKSSRPNPFKFNSI
ncbi:MAG: hypothetical protein A3H72_00895 [Candidatus Doudnabacteria bacterium RIFCSPLOWO2_02_FULL_48_8]|uniref:Homing endonuclease LAGLIDADG domain-containing protein n=1 Tax=Candidatus Doudnabacteria bacterium RIFCSPHIGHO2_01_FULL_46_24 TaxID=1817825 RepID=A0A1F5NU30_9BACT|nr:MAG: hypothetical protein A2720_01110 [Candidatus Doudnabacteria bacterium RIFCSPHIGHO2_01_FULL_46_24]OGE95188.1 MAG: hypothetical protein A3H72_00895 [Candidatus Doudnabacteria bacterium RIFCSPLOWO2_02_FULL_48_8]OGE96102.1 MAG: hypothetical protein A3E98_02550 [Candidatus Doudnabacteria bacterium RIFCSPHIGHO2_12_FULL_48_11]